MNFLRSCSSKKHLTSPRVLWRLISRNTPDDYELVYSFSNIKSAVAINSWKLKHSILSGVTCPLLFGLEFMNIIPQNTSEGVLLVALVSNGLLYSLGQIFYKTCGKIYWHEKEEKVKFAFVGFFGQRQELEVPLENIIPLNEVNRPPFIEKLHEQNPGAMYRKIEIMEPKMRLKIFGRQYDFYNDELVRKILGESFEKNVF